MNATARYPHVKYRSESSGSVSGAGTLLLTETARALRLVEALEVELGGFMRPNAVASAGLVPLIALAEAAGLRALVASHVSVPTDKGANADLKTMSLTRTTSSRNHLTRRRNPGPTRHHVEHPGRAVIRNTATPPTESEPETTIRAATPPPSVH